MLKLCVIYNESSSTMENFFLEPGNHVEVRIEILYCFFFFQAEDGIRDYKVTGVQTCALPICSLTENHWNHPFLNREPLEPSVPKEKNM